MYYQNVLPFTRFVRRLEMSDFLRSTEVRPIDSRLFFCEKGTGKFWIDHEYLVIEEGSVLFIQSGYPYKVLPGSATYLAVNFDFNNDYSDKVFPINPVSASTSIPSSSLHITHFEDVDCFENYHVFPNCNALTTRMLKLEAEYTKKMPYYINECASILLSVLNTLVRKYQAGPTEDQRFNLNEIVTYIHNNSHNDINNNVLSEVFHFHPNYISSEFRRRMGTPVHQYLLQTRIYNAVSLIESGVTNITLLSQQVGFQDSNYFSRYFKKITGVSPSQYMKSNYLND